MPATTRQAPAGTPRSSSRCCRRCPAASAGEAGRDREDRHHGADHPQQPTTPRSAGAAGSCRDSVSASSMTNTGAQARLTNGTRQPARSAHAGLGSGWPWWANAAARRAISQFVSTTRARHDHEHRDDADRDTAPGRRTGDPRVEQHRPVDDQQHVAHQVDERGRAQHAHRRRPASAAPRSPTDPPRVASCSTGAVELLDQTPPGNGQVARRRTELAPPAPRGRRRARAHRDPAISRRQRRPRASWPSARAAPAWTPPRSGTGGARRRQQRAAQRGHQTRCSSRTFHRVPHWEHTWIIGPA